MRHFDDFDFQIYTTTTSHRQPPIELQIPLVSNVAFALTLPWPRCLETANVHVAGAGGMQMTLETTFSVFSTQTIS